MRSSMPWGKRFLALLVLGSLLMGISGCGQTPMPSIQPEASEPSAWGIIGPGDNGNTRYRTQVHGTLIVDRSFAGDYLLSVGYSEDAVTAL